jgi:adenylyltransferase/sulfurtransferase
MDARYARNVLLKDVGTKGQRKLCNSTVLIIGVGGVGSYAAAELAGMGVNLTLCDCDKVEKTNLNRQFLYDEEDIGLDKADAAKNRLEQFNPQIRINAEMDFHRLDFKEFDVAMDCTDNLDSRIEISRECKKKGVPLVYASAVGHVARVSVFRKKYLHEIVTKGKGGEGCDAIGIFPPAAAIAGSFAASEAVKIILGMKSGLEGKMLVMDCEKNKMGVLKI